MKKLLGIFLLISTQLTAQTNLDFIQEKPIGVPFFDMNSFTFYNDKKEAVVSTLVRLENKSIQYIQNNGKYESSYEITFMVTDQQGTVIRNETKKDGQTVGSYEATLTSSTYRIQSYQNILKGGDYSIKVSIRDLNTNKSFEKINKMTVISYENQPLLLSDVSIIETVTDTSNKSSIVPLIDDIVTNADKGFSIYFELYQQSMQNKMIRFSIELENLNQTEPKTSFLLGTVDYVVDKRAKQEVFHKFDSKIIPSGDYQLIVKAKNSADSVLLVRSKNYSFGWVNAPTSETDLDIAIDQLVYFAKTEVRDAMLKAPNFHDKTKLFFVFWEKWDPTPGTAMNEMMNEYYNRVKLSNKLFRAFRVPGWKTDRGMVYIMYGQPDYTESKLSSADTKPYEIWYYYDIHKKYYFMDHTGYGDYRLMNSLTGESSDLK